MSGVLTNEERAHALQAARLGDGLRMTPQASDWN